jgi:ATP-dependent helicase/DNAse subunit B
MALTLITGPAGSGKTGEILDAFVDSLEREPVLVVPTGADVQRYEEELLFRARVAVGGRITAFGGLVDLVARACGVVSAPSLTAVQRQAVMADVARHTQLQDLGPSAGHSGFPAALDSFIGELQAGLVGPDDFAARARRMGRTHLTDLAKLYSAYCARRDQLGRSDEHTLAAAATRALAADAAPWGGRPVLVHGFDDLSVEQLALVRALAMAGEVTVSVLHEDGRACLVARQRLVDQLQELAADLPPGESEHRRLDPAGRDDALAHLERAFLTDSVDRREDGGQVVFLDSAGERSEIELAGAEVARLLRTGSARPEDVVLIARSPERIANLVEQVFGDFGIPVAVHARSGFGSSAAGSALLALGRAVLAGGTAADLVAYLRCPGRAAPHHVDALERATRQGDVDSVERALEIFAEVGGRELWEVERLRDAAAAGGTQTIRALVDLAKDVFEYPVRRTAPVLDEAGRADQLAAEQAAAALEEVAVLCEADPSLAPDPEDILTLLAGLGIRRHRGGVAGRVELMSPYRARARQHSHVFVLSLQEGIFPRGRADDPFLSEAERTATGLPPRAEQRDEERLLFYDCLTRPTKRLYLSHRSSDEEGAVAVRSFFLDDVEELLEPGAPVLSRGLADTVFDLADAPSAHEVARAIALREELVPPASLGAAPELTERLERMLEAAHRQAHHLPGSLRSPVVLEELAGRTAFGASSLEEYWGCPFRYFVRHELRPDELAPPHEALAKGSLVHAVLDRLYTERFLGTRPFPDDVEEAVGRAREILEELAPEYALEPSTPRRVAIYRRIQSDISRFLRWDAANPLGEKVVAVEGSFGEHEGADKPSLELDGFTLHGMIDRIDAVAGGGALVRDYKNSARVTPMAQLDDWGKLQLQLYTLAVKRLWGLEPRGAVYHALAATERHMRPRGILAGPRESAPFDPAAVVKTDFTADQDEFDDLLAKAAGKAAEIARDIQGGRLRRDPIGGTCPKWCDLHTICRMERGEKKPPEEEERENWRGDDDG